MPYEFPPNGIGRTGPECIFPRPVGVTSAASRHLWYPRQLSYHSPIGIGRTVSTLLVLRRYAPEAISNSASAVRFHQLFRN